MLQMTRVSTTAFRPAAIAPGDDAGLPGFEGRMLTRTFRPGELVCGQGEAADQVFYVRRGVLRVYKVTLDGRRQIVGFVGEGDLLGLACDGEYPCSAEALTQAAVSCVTRASLDRVAERSPLLGLRLLSFARKEIAAAQEQMLLLGRMSPVERVASFLIRLCEAAEARGGDADRLALPMSRLDIADHLGLTIETVSRCFTKLRKARIIALPLPADVVVLDADRLAELALGDEDSLRRAA